jgi:hypothetical protein
MLRDALSEAFTWSPVTKPQSADELAKLLSAAGPRTIGVYVAKGEVCALVSPKEVDLLAALEPKRKPAWRSSPYSIFHRYIVDEVFGPRFCDHKPPTIHYHKTIEEAIADARAHAGIAALMPATRMTDLRDICTAS